MIEPKIAVECEGGFFGMGPKCRCCGRRKVAGHTSIQRLLGDSEKYNTATAMGFRVLRVTHEQITSGEAIAWLKQAMVQQ